MQRHAGEVGTGGVLRGCDDSSVTVRRWLAKAACLAMPALMASGCARQDGEAVAQPATCRVAQRLVSLPTVVPESSGAAMRMGRPPIIWTHNDSGGEAELFAISPTGELLGRVQVGGAENVDWEDLAIGSCPSGTCLYIADTGDNAGEREEIAIYRVPEPEPGQGTTPAAERFAARFPDQPQDTEAMFVLPPDRIYLVTKGDHGPIALYRYPGDLRANQTVDLELVRRLSERVVPLADRVTAADASADGQRIALRTHRTLLLYGADELLGSAETIVPASVDLSALGEPQGEGLAFGPNGAVVLTSEGGMEGFAGMLGILWCPAS